MAKSPGPGRYAPESFLCAGLHIRDLNVSLRSSKFPVAHRETVVLLSRSRSHQDHFSVGLRMHIPDQDTNKAPSAHQRCIESAKSSTDKISALALGKTSGHRRSALGALARRSVNARVDPHPQDRMTQGMSSTSREDSRDYCICKPWQSKDITALGCFWVDDRAKALVILMSNSPAG